MNSIDVDTDGNILLSSRNTSECTKIDRNTGDIIWRLGGPSSTLTFPNDPLNGPANQHALRMVGTNDYTLFDDGNLHNPSVSRGVEYVVNTNNMTATMVWQYPPTPNTALYSYYMGNAQRLTNGNTLIDWAVGNLPKLTEVRPDGTKAFEMNWVNQYEAYRTWRCSWPGVAVQPYLLLESYPDNVTLIFNQFGDTNVAYYRIYGGPTSQSTNFLDRFDHDFGAVDVSAKRRHVLFPRHRRASRRHGRSVFKRTKCHGQPDPAGPEHGRPTGIFPWARMAGFCRWPTAGRRLGPSPIGVSYFYDYQRRHLRDGHPVATDRLPPASRGSNTFLSFDAWATRPRYIQAEVGQAASPYLNYSSLAATSLTPVHDTFPIHLHHDATIGFQRQLDVQPGHFHRRRHRCPMFPCPSRRPRRRPVEMGAITLEQPSRATRFRPRFKLGPIT